MALRTRFGLRVTLTDGTVRPPEMWSRDLIAVGELADQVEQEPLVDKVELIVRQEEE